MWWWLEQRLITSPGWNSEQASFKLTVATWHEDTELIYLDTGGLQILRDNNVCPVSNLKNLKATHETSDGKNRT